MPGSTLPCCSSYNSIRICMPITHLCGMNYVPAQESSAASWGKQKSITSNPNAVASDSSGPLAVAVGSRAHLEKEALAKRSKLRNFLMHGFHFLVTFVAGHAVADTQCGFKMFTRRAAAVLYTNQRLQRWCFDVELLYLAQTLGVPVREVQVRQGQTDGQTRQTAATDRLLMLGKVVSSSC